MEMREIEVIDINVEMQVFDPVAQAVAEAKEKNANLVFDYEDKQGNKDARSHIAQLRKLKAPISEVHKTAKAEAKKFCDALDAKKRELIGAVDEMIEVHHKPIKEIDDREARKKAEEEARIQAEKDAEEARKHAELEERERKIREQEEKVRAEQERLEREKRERELQEQAKREAEEWAKTELERAERAKQEAEERAKQARVSFRIREEQAKLKAKQQAEAEQRRIAEEKAKREADEQNRNRVHKAIYDALLSKVGLMPNDAKAVGTALRDGKIPHVNIQY